MLFIYFHSSRSPLPLSCDNEREYLLCSFVIFVLFLCCFLKVFYLILLINLCAFFSAEVNMLMSELIKQTGLYEKGF